MSPPPSSREAPAAPKEKGHSQTSNANALRIAGRRFRKRNATDPEEEGLSDAEICGVWAFAWIPETSQRVRPENSRVYVNKVSDPLGLLDPHNLTMGAFVDGFARHPELVIKLLGKFRRYIRRFGAPGPSCVHAVCFYADQWNEDEHSKKSGKSSAHAAPFAKGTGKDAAYCLAKVETGVGRQPTVAAVQSAGRKIRRHKAHVKASVTSPYWPYVPGTGADPIPKKQRQRADKNAG